MKVYAKLSGMSTCGMNQYVVDIYVYVNTTAVTTRDNYKFYTSLNMTP